MVKWAILTQICKLIYKDHFDTLSLVSWLNTLVGWTGSINQKRSRLSRFTIRLPKLKKFLSLAQNSKSRGQFSSSNNSKVRVNF